MAAVIKSGILAQGPDVAEFERPFADYCGEKHAIAVNGGTGAIHTADTLRIPAVSLS